MEHSGGGKVGPRTGWALGRRIQISPYIAPRPMKLRVETAHVRICSDARTNKAGMAAVALLRNEFVVELRGPAYEVLLKALQVTNEIYGSETSATVAAIRALGDELRGRASIVLSDNNAAAGAPV